VNDQEFTWSKSMTELANKLYMMQTEIERLRNERDEARRRVCEMLHEEGYGRSPEEWAKRKRWDCFKENTNV
jgi:hypothetical protein